MSDKRPIGKVLIKDVSDPEYAAIVISFDTAPEGKHWQEIHRDLQKKYGANFPYSRRKALKYRGYQNCFGFYGIKELLKQDKRNRR